MVLGGSQKYKDFEPCCSHWIHDVEKRIHDRLRYLMLRSDVKYLGSEVVDCVTGVAAYVQKHLPGMWKTGCNPGRRHSREEMQVLLLKDAHDFRFLHTWKRCVVLS